MDVWFTVCECPYFTSCRLYHRKATYFTVLCNTTSVAGARPVESQACVHVWRRRDRYSARRQATTARPSSHLAPTEAHTARNILFITSDFDNFANLCAPCEAHHQMQFLMGKKPVVISQRGSAGFFLYLNRFSAQGEKIDMERNRN